MKSNSGAKKLTAEVKEVAFKAGADLAGVVSAAAIDAVPSHWIGWEIQQYTKKTTEMMPDARSVVVVAFHVWDDVLETALRKKEKWVYPGYFPLSTLTNEVAFFLKTKGYKTFAFPSLLSYKRLAQLAGFGTFGKNALIINPEFGPWIRLSAVLTNAELVPNRPFEENLCGDCDECVKVCPTNALTPYKVDDSRCLVGINLTEMETSKYAKELRRYEPSLTENSHLMCVECQKACKYGRRKRE